MTAYYCGLSCTLEDKECLQDQCGQLWTTSFNWNTWAI